MVTRAGNQPGRDGSLDCLRLYAAGVVLLQHASLAGLSSNHSPHLKRAAQVLGPSSGIAVNLFFVLSGYVLIKSFVRTRSLKTFVVRRLARLYPLYAVVGLVLIACNYGTSRRPLTAAEYFSFTSVYTGNYLLGPAWTLCVEIAFTLFLVVTALWASSRARPRKLHAGLIFMLLFPPALGWILVGLFHTNRYPEPEAPLIGCLAFFAGCLAGLQQGRADNELDPVVIRRRRATLLLGVSIWVVTIPLSVLSPGRLYLRLAVDAAVTLSSVLVVLNHTSSWRVGAWCGRRSYGIYLWHVPLLGLLLSRNAMPVRLGDFGGTAVLTVYTFGATLVLAAVTYSFVELPGLRYGSRRARSGVGRQPQPRGRGGEVSM